jgi:hypothetical protein
MILTLPRLVFDFQISKFSPLEAKIFCFEKNIFET